MTVAVAGRPSDALRVEPGRSALPFGFALVLLALAGGVVPIVFAWHFGALGIPRNDDWAYAFAAFHFAGTGHVNGYSWAGMNLVGQLFVAYPVVSVFGHRIAALQVEVAALGVVGLLATFDLAKQLLTPRRALFVAVLVAVLPMWASLSASYMTDVPAFALAMVCLALGARGVASGAVRPGYFFASLAVGFLAFTIRENAAVAPAAVGAVTVWVAAREPRPRLWRLVTAIAGFAVSVALFYSWRRNLPGFINEAPTAPSLSSINRAAQIARQSALLVGLFVAPAVVLADPRRLLRVARARTPRAALVAAAVTVAVAGPLILQRGAPAAVLGPGDYVLANGSLGTEMLKGTRPDLVPRWLLAVLAVAGVLALAVMVGAATAAVTSGVARMRRRTVEPAASPALPIITLAVIGYAVSYAVSVALAYTHLFDRYLIPIVPLVAILVLHSRGPRGLPLRGVRIASCATLTALAAFGAVYAANSASFDGTKWRVATQAVSLAKDPKRVDGGHIWNDAQARRHLRGPFKGACVVLRAAARPPATGEAGVVGVGSVWGLTGTQTWVVARQVRAC